MSDVVVAVCILGGAGFMLVAAIGILRLPDLYQRLHATSKAATLGVALILSGAAVASGELGLASRCAMAVIFFVLSAPVGAHLIARAADLIGEPAVDGTVDERRLKRAADAEEKPVQSDPLE